MQISRFKRSIAIILLAAFSLGIIFPFHSTAAAAGSGSRPSVINQLISRLKPSDNLSVGERASGVVQRIKDGEPIVANKNIPANLKELSPFRASVTSGASALKNSFSVSKIGFSAASTVGMKLFDQVRKGEKLDIGKAVGTLATGKYIGSFVGSGIGSAVGNMAGTLLATSVPGIGPVLGAFMPALFSMTGGALAGQMGSDVDKGIMPSFKRAWASIDKVDLVARAAGTTIGSVLGSILLPGIGTAVGSFLGGMIASKLVSLVRKKKDPGAAPSSNKADNIRYGVEPEGVILNIIPEADAALYLKYDAVDIKLGERAKKLKDNIIAAYRKYVRLISEGFSYSSNECQQTFTEFKQAVNEYNIFRNSNINKVNAR